jgi:hypothetical protein
LGFFEEVGEKPKRISYQTEASSQPRRSSVQRFVREFGGARHEIGTTFRSVDITSRGFEGDDLSDTWTPSSTASAAHHGRIIEAFFQSSRPLEREKTSLLELPFRLFNVGFSACYIFSYPFVFSPIAYASGLSYSPNVRKFGETTHRDGERVANWANHCYRGQRASDGYLRDVYPMSLIGPEHLAMPLGEIDLETWIRQDPNRGNLTRLRDKFVWEIGDENLRTVQNALDRFRILLAGFPPL